jgi:hypothetical protein
MWKEAVKALFEEKLFKTTENLSQYSWCLVQDMKLGTSKYKTGQLPT